MSHVSYSRTGTVGRIEMQRPPANSYEVAFMRDLDRAITMAEDDAGCRAVIIRSALPGFFCGGADISQVRDHLMFGQGSLEAAGLRAAGLPAKDAARA